MTPGSKPIKSTEAGVRLHDAAVDVIRAQGYTATTVDDICLRAGLTKGGFFHHFRSKNDCAVAAAAHFAANAETLFESAAFRGLDDPRERVLGYVDFRKAVLQGDLPQFTWLLGTMVQEACETHPAIRACDRYICDMPPLSVETSGRRRRFTRPTPNRRRTARRSSRNRAAPSFERRLKK
jgi:TetR/AcrR family transcriptional repressor of nem operon